MNRKTLGAFDRYLEWRVETGFVGWLDAMSDEPPVWRCRVGYIRL
jgi:hypothetical protein